MGVHIIVKKIIKKTIEENFSRNVIYYETEKQEWFDTLRYAGDKDFIFENDFEYIEDTKENQNLVRPKDFNKCQKWVKTNIVSSNIERLLIALDKMEIDENLCFYWSW